MPSESKKQARTMAMCCNNPKGKEVCEHIPHKVACEFHDADKRRRHSERDGYFRLNKGK